MDTIKLLGKRIWELRRKRGWTQAKLAEMADLSDNYIGYLERGVQSPSIDTLERLSKALKVGVKEFFVFPGDVEHKDIRRDKKEYILNKLVSCLKEEDINYISMLYRLARRGRKGRAKQK